MKIAIIDADLIGRKKHRFPNLACEKISGYWKDNGADVQLKLDYNNLDSFDQVFVSKVFTDTHVPEWLHETDKIHLGGTGFFFDKAPNLPDEIEHSFPDYGLYDEWIKDKPKNEIKEYTDYCIGFMTRGCFRKCKFCVNQKYDHVFQNSPLKEFYYDDCKKICLLDDNFLGCTQWKQMLQQLIDTGKPFRFKQGLDVRLFTDEKCEMLFHAKYDDHIMFAFDNIEDYDLIESKLQMIRRHSDSTHIKFYVLVGFESTDVIDIMNAFKRIELLMRYHCFAYIMRYQNKNETPWNNSKYRGMYITLARWCNQPNFFKQKSFREFCHSTAQHGSFSALKYMEQFEQEHPDIAKQYFDMKWR